MVKFAVYLLITLVKRSFEQIKNSLIALCTRNGMRMKSQDVCTECKFFPQNLCPLQYIIFSVEQHFCKKKSSKKAIILQSMSFFLREDVSAHKRSTTNYFFLYYDVPAY